jgi:phosphoglycerate dehydrogenase-like enzyme
VIVTPHVGGISHRSIAAMNEMATRSVIAVLSGEIPANIVNKQAR